MRSFWKRPEETESIRDIASELSFCCQTLDKESIGIIIESFGENGHFILSGDTSCNLNLPRDLQYKFDSIEADSMLNGKKLKEFQEFLVSRLLENGVYVTSNISDERYYILISKDGKWQPCVTMVTKEFTLI